MTDAPNLRFKKVKLAFDSISVYRPILEDNVIDKLYELIDYIAKGKYELNIFLKLYNEFFFILGGSFSGSLKDYMVHKILFDENPYTLRAEKQDTDSLKGSILKVAEKDLNNLQLIAEVSSVNLKACILETLDMSEFEAEALDNLPDWELEYKNVFKYGLKSGNFKSIKDIFHASTKWSECIEALTEFYKNHGCGMFSRYKAFVWEHSDSYYGLKGIDAPDSITLSELVGYNAERSKIIENTLQFLDGFPANNVLLYGDRGTGKSSTVKALLNEYHMQGLRIIEVPKLLLTDFPEIIRCVKDRGQKFIIFVDDLAFEDSEESYIALKAILEGGLESKPNNVLIYATSNRRHLVKEKFSERAGINSGNHSDEVNASDSMQEKLSLADRFGITVVFSSPDKIKYLEIVEGIAAKRGLNIDKEQLHREALKWELWYNGRSPRTARQFVDWIEGYMGLKHSELGSKYN